MSGLCVVSGAIQDTSRLVPEPDTADTVGVAGASGGSFTSAISMTTVAAAVPPWPSSAVTVTE